MTPWTMARRAAQAIFEHARFTDARRNVCRVTGLDQPKPVRETEIPPGARQFVAEVQEGNGKVHRFRFCVWRLDDRA